jgi:beta-1,4-mannosyl-glycoprotein beta-1,4-N-acetylglucosaminyltransferase
MQVKIERQSLILQNVRLDQRPNGPNDFWKNENFIRNNIANGLSDAKPDDWILISDLDEIPNPIVIKQYDPAYKRADLLQRYYSYYLNNYWLGDVDANGKLIANSNIWHGTKITTYKHFVEYFKSNASSVRIYKSSGLLRGLKRAWFKLFQSQIIQNGGWHFTWIFSIENIIKKIESTAHQEFNREDHKDPARITALICSGRDVNKPYARYELQKLDQEFPAYILENFDKFSQYTAQPGEAES